MKVIRWSNDLRVFGLGLVLLAGGTPVAADEALGRLFLSPAQRESLERMRNSGNREIQLLQGATLRLDGIVQRSSGKKTVWINGQAQHDDEHLAGFVADLPGHASGLVTVHVEDEPPARLQVGETINRTTRETSTLLGAGKVVVSPQRATR